MFEVPFRVKLISLQLFLGGLSTAGLGLLALFGVPSALGLWGASASASWAIGLFLCLICFALAFLSWVLGKALWQGKSWARSLVGLFAFLGVVLFVLSLGSLGTWWSALMSALVVKTLAFDREVDRAFS